jgi:hypothetical protein
MRTLILYITNICVLILHILVIYEAAVSSMRTHILYITNICVLILHILVIYETAVSSMRTHILLICVHILLCLCAGEVIYFFLILLRVVVGLWLWLNLPV